MVSCTHLPIDPYSFWTWVTFTSILRVAYSSCTSDTLKPIHPYASCICGTLKPIYPYSLCTYLPSKPYSSCTSGTLKPVYPYSLCTGILIEPYSSRTSGTRQPIHSCSSSGFQSIRRFGNTNTSNTFIHYHNPWPYRKANLSSTRVPACISGH